MVGYVKIHRDIVKWEWYKVIPIRILFEHLIYTACFEDTNFRNVMVKRGQRLTGRKELSFETGLSEQQIRTALNKLLSTNEITIKTTKDYSVISIINYDLYQDSNQQDNQQVTNRATSRITTNKEDKNIKNNNINIITKKFLKPSVEEIRKYCLERNNSVNPQKFYDFYESNGWKVGKNPMKDWMASIRTWERSEIKKPIYKNDLTKQSLQNFLNREE